MQGKLDEQWEGPFEVTDTPNDVHVLLEIPGGTLDKNIGKRDHINLVKCFIQEAMIHHLVVVDDEDPDREFPKAYLDGDPFTKAQ